MRFEWDEEKNDANQRKHTVAFEIARAFLRTQTTSCGRTV